MKNVLVHKIKFWFSLSIASFILVGGLPARAASSQSRSLTTNGPDLSPVPLKNDASNLSAFLSATRVFLGTQPINPVEHPRDNLVVLGGVDVENNNPANAAAGNDGTSRPVYINIAVGTEALGWFEKAYDTLVDAKKNKLPDGRTFFVNLEGKGSINATHAIVESARTSAQGGNQGTHYTVWVPAASVYKTMVSDHFRSSPFVSEESLVQSPVVYVTYEQPQTTISQNYPLVGTGMNLVTIGQILANELKAGTGIIKSNGHNFVFGTTDPAQSSTGAILLMTAANEFFETTTHGHTPDIDMLNDPDFQGFLALIKGNTQNNLDSTENLGGKMSAQIPTLDSGFMYESSAINVIKTLRKRGKKHVKVRYPKYNFMTDHPYYILATGTTPSEQLAAREFLNYLLSDEIQKMAAVDFNFRPVKPVIDEDGQDDIFKQYAADGIQPTEKLGDLYYMDPPSRAFIEAVSDIYKGVSFQNSN